MSKILLVTGGSRGIGAACARLAGTLGYDVCVNYVSNQAAAQAVVDDVIAKGQRAIAVQADVSKEADVVRLFQEMDEKLGTVTALINNAGIISPMATILELDAERLANTWTTNITSMFLCAREAVRRMSAKQGGSGGAIVNLSSAAARLGGGGQFLDYATSKGAADTFNHGLAQELAGQGIRVNTVSPGAIYYEGGNWEAIKGMMPELYDGTLAKMPMGRFGNDEEVAKAIVFVASPAVPYMTGANLVVDGGFTQRVQF